MSAPRLEDVAGGIVSIQRVQLRGWVREIQHYRAKRQQPLTVHNATDGELGLLMRDRAELSPSDREAVEQEFARRCNEGAAEISRATTHTEG